MKCYKCKREFERYASPLCDSCLATIPRRNGIPDLTQMRRHVIKPKQFVDEETGQVIEDNPPLNKKGFWHKPGPNELWAQRGMDGKRKNHI